MISDPDWMQDHRRVWDAKPGLRHHYRTQVFDRVLAAVSGGRTLEIGAGPGFLKAYHSNHIAVDVCPSSALDVCADVHGLPFPDASFQNIVGVDVIHHLSRPQDALIEMTRVLKPDGVISLIEPWTGGLARLFYRWIHHEACCTVNDPWRGPFAGNKSPMDGNTMISKQLFYDDLLEFNRRLPDLHPTSVKLFGSLSYLLTGGFQPAGAPQWLTDALAHLELVMPQPLMRIFGTRAHYCFQKKRI